MEVLVVSEHVKDDKKAPWRTWGTAVTGYNKCLKIFYARKITLQSKKTIFWPLASLIVLRLKLEIWRILSTLAGLYFVKRSQAI